MCIYNIYHTIYICILDYVHNIMYIYTYVYICIHIQIIVHVYIYIIYIYIYIYHIMYIRLYVFHLYNMYIYIYTYYNHININCCKKNGILTRDSLVLSPQSATFLGGENFLRPWQWAPWTLTPSGCSSPQKWHKILSKRLIRKNETWDYIIIWFI